MLPSRLVEMEDAKGRGMRHRWGARRVEREVELASMLCFGFEGVNAIEMNRRRRAPE